MKKPRRPRIDQTPAQSRIMQAAHREIKPPVNIPLTEDALIFFDEIINESARANWSEHQISLACMLARAMAMLNKNQTLLANTGDLIKTKKGDVVISPLKKSVEDTMTSIASWRRSLGLHARALHGEKRSIIKRAGMEMDLEDLLEDDEGLLAVPTDYSH